MDCVEKLRNCFDEMVVYKDLKKTNFFSALSLPSFMRDWLLKKFEDDEGYFDKDDLARFVKKYIPRKDDWTSIKNRIIIEGETKRKEGLIAGNDFVTLDEVQTISFTDTDEMRAALKGYLEQGNFTVGDYKGVADAGVILCGNIRKEIMDADGYSNMFTELPVVFHESALIERFHGFIKGWNIPRMNDDLKVDGWALNSEYFCAIMHELRGDMTYRSIVDELIIVPDGADTRDTEAVKRISTAYLKLLFPHVQNVSDISPREFKRYCLDRARKMRDTIKYQLGLLDVEYSGKDLPLFGVKGLE